jgi:hypothetical protein
MVHLFLGEDEGLTRAPSLQVARQPHRTWRRLRDLEKRGGFAPELPGFQHGTAWSSERFGTAVGGSATRGLLEAAKKGLSRKNGVRHIICESPRGISHRIDEQVGDTYGCK